MLARSPTNQKRATAYLIASGAVPLTIIVRDGGCSIATGKITGTIAARWWLHAQDAQRVAGAARRLAGGAPDIAAAIAAVARAAGSLRAVLTTDEAAIRRAADSMVRLDAMLNRMKRDGTLHQFNRRYKIERAAALAEGKGFMSYGNATRRLKLALIPGLQSGKPVTGLFAEVFR
jgi:ABC-type transporter Mla subunit MlaD